MIKVSNFTTKQGTKKVLYKGCMVEFKRVKNDVYGNPLYRVYPVNFSFVHLSYTYKNYEKFNGEKSYYLLQSYNIETSIENLINCLINEHKYEFPEFNKELVNDWINVLTLNDND